MSDTNIHKKTPILQLSPELADGDSSTVCDNLRGLIESITAWYDEFKDQPGEGFQVEVIEMSKAEVDALPQL